MKGRGSVRFGLFGLASQGRIIAVGLVSGGVVIGPLFVGALGRVSERRSCQHGRGDGSSEVGDIGRTDSGLPATGRTGAAFLSRVPELPVLGLLGRSKLGIHFFRVMLVLDGSDLVNFGLRDKPLLSSVGVTPTATTAAGLAATLTANAAACDGGELVSLGNTRVRFLASLGGHIHVHHALEILEPRVVDQDGVPSGVKRGVLDPVFKKKDLHALLKWVHTVLHEGSVMVVLCHMSETILVEVKVLAVALINLRLEG